MGFVHATQIKNKSHPHPHLSLLQDLLLFVVNATTCKWWASKASSKQLPSRHNRDFIINRNINKSNNHVSTVHKKDIIIQLPYLGLHSWHSSQISKRLKSCVYNFYSCVNHKIIFQNSLAASNLSFLTRPAWIVLNSRKLFTKPLFWDCKDVYILKSKQRLRDWQTERFKTFKALDNNDHTSAIADHINTTEHPNVKAKNHYHYKIKETFLMQYLKPAFNVNVSREKLML